MAVVVNTPTTERQTDSGAGFLVGIILLVLLAFALFYYGLPALRNASQGSGTNINVPDRINVDVNQGAK